MVCVVGHGGAKVWDTTHGSREVKQGTEKQTAPSATQTTPVSERTYEGCHHSKDSDA